MKHLDQLPKSFLFNVFNKIKAVFAVLIFFVFSTGSFAADYFWVGGSGNWSEFGIHWATTSGGAVFHMAVPGPSDDVYFDANSFTMPLEMVTVDVMATCNSMDWTGVTNNPDFGGFNSLDVYGSVIFDAGMTASYNSNLNFRSSNPGNIINFSTVPLSIMGVMFEGNGDWTFMSDMDLSMMGGSFQLSQGTVNTNSFTISVSWIDSWAPNTRAFIFGNSTINVQNMNMWNVSTLSIDAGTSTINLESNWFNGMGFTFYDLNFVPTWPGVAQLDGSNTFHTLGLENPNITGLTLSPGMTTTLYDINFGATCSNRKTVQTWNPGESATIKKITGAVEEDYLNIKDITIIGGATFITNNGVDMGNVVNWTINTSVSDDYYWVGGTGSWSDGDHWSTTSGGPYPSGGTCVPSGADNVFFDANSFTLPGDIVTVDVIAFFNDIDWTGVTNFPNLSMNWPGQFYIYGSLTFDPAMILNANGNFNFMATDAGNTITTAGHTINSTIYFSGSGDWTLQDGLNCGSIYFNEGYLMTNNNNINGSQVYSSTSLNRQLDLGSSVISLNSSWWIDNSTNMTLNAGTSTINMSGWSFYGGGFTYNDVSFSNATNTSVYNSNTFNVLTLVSGDLTLEAGQTQIVNDLFGAGDCGNFLNIKSSTDGVVTSISKAAGTVNVDYVALQDITALGGATFNANNGVDMGNVTGWNFTLLGSTDYYWIGGSGNWSDPLNWSLSSGGPANVGGCIPTQVDNVFFDANSGLINQTVTLDQAAYCNDMDWTGVDNNGRLGGTQQLYIFGSLTFDPAMLVLNTGNIYFKSDNPGNTITSANKTFRANVYFEGDGEWTLQDNFTHFTTSPNWRRIYFNKGSLITNNNNITTHYFNSYTEDVRQLDLGSSLVTVNSWSCSNGTNLTVTPGTSTINSAYGTFYGGSQPYNDVNINVVGYASIYGGNGFNNLNIPSATTVRFEGGLTQTFNTLTIPAGTDCNNYLNIGTLNAGVVAGLSMPAGVFNGDWLTITDLTAGGGGTFNATNSQGVGDVTGWNITSPGPVDLYWIGDAGDWNDPLNWSLTSGGVPYGCIPTSEDNVFFDINSFSAPLQYVNVNVEGYCKNMDWTGVTNNPDLQGWSQLNINGSITLVSGMTVTYSGTLNFTSAAAGNNITTAGQVISGIRFSGSGDYTLQDELSLMWNGITFNNGTFNTNNQNINGSDATFTTNSTSIRTMNLGSSVITINSWDVQDNTNFTLNAGTSEIITSVNTWTFTGGGLTYYDVSIVKPMWGDVTINGSNTFNTLYIEEGASVRFEEGVTQTTTDFLATGSSGTLINLYSTTAGVAALINQTSHDFCGDWLNIQDLSVGTQMFYAGSNSNDLGNNAGWTWSGVIANDQYPDALCEDVPGGGTASGVDLTALEAAIDGGLGYGHTWYEDAGLTLLVPDPTDVTVSHELIFYDEVDNGICTNIAQVIYTVDPPSTSAVIPEVSCNGGNDGAIDLTVETGPAPFTFVWDSGPTTEDISGLTAGTYIVTVTDAVGCQVVDSYIVNEPLPVTATISASTDVTCNGDCNGDATVTPGGGVGGYWYLWDDPFAQGTPTAIGLCAGTFNVTVTDANGCDDNTSVVINENPIVTASIAGFTNVICNGDCDGTATAAGAGGTGSFSYIWDDPGAQTTATAIGLCPGNWNVTATDGNGCFASASQLITQNPVLTVAMSATDANCGNNDGDATATPAGGEGTYSYIWDDPGAQTTQTAINLFAGTFNVTVSDGIGCTATDFAVVNNLSTLTATITASTDVTCNGVCNGDATVAAAGGTPPYGYLWDDPGPQTTSTAIGLCAGTWSVTVTDANTCQAIDNVIITEPLALTISVLSSTNVTCNGGADGAIDIDPVGGTPGYLYSWEGPVPYTNNIEDIAGLEAGTYDLTVTDALGCANTASVDITEPVAMSNIFNPVLDASCFGYTDGSATANPSGGTTPYTYTWDPSGLGTKLYPGVGGPINEITTNDFPMFISGLGNLDGVAYSFAQICVNINHDRNQDLDIFLISPDATTIELVSAMGGPNPDGFVSTCFDQSAPTSIVTEIEPFIGTFRPEVDDLTLFNNGQPGDGIWTLRIIETANPGGPGMLNSWSIAFDTTKVETTPTISGVGAGAYNVTITDINGCQLVDNVTISEPPALTSIIAGTDALCFGGSNGAADLSVGGGTPPYTYLWDDAGASTTEDLANISAGTYNVITNDDSGCQIADNVIIGEGIQIVTNIFVTDANCGNNDGDATVMAVGGAPPYTYEWSDLQTTMTAINLVAGTYPVTVTDDIGCTATDVAVVNNISTLVASITGSTDNICFGDCNGDATVTAAGGTPPYNFIWDDPGLQTTAIATGLCAGTFNVTVTDAATCQIIDNVTITEPTQLTASAVVSSDYNGENISCNGAFDGAIDLIPVGSSGIYEYSWAGPNGFTDNIEDIAALEAGTYDVTVNDLGNPACNVTTQIILTEPVLLSISVDAVNDVSCFGLSDGEIQTTAAGGTGAYVYNWTNTGQTTEDITGLTANTYDVTVTDANACQADNTASVAEPGTLTISIDVVNDVTCFGDADGSIQATTAGGTAPYSYNWTNTVQTTEDISVLGPNTYDVEVTDAKGCIASDGATVLEPAVLAITIDAATDVTCFGDGDGSILTTTSGGNGTNTYVWTNTGQTTEDIINLGPNTYDVEVTDAKGCIANNGTTILEPAVLTISIDAVTDVTCFGDNDGDIQATSVGGTGIHTYTWTNTVQTTEDISLLGPNTYDVTVTDANLCQETNTALVLEPSLLVVTVDSITDATCNGDTDGAIYTSVAGGTAPYGFVWTNTAQTTEDITLLGTNTYDVEVTDANACIANNDANVYEPIPVTATTSVVNANCGNNDGSATVNPADGVSPYTYLWTGGQTTQTAINLIAGSYDVTVADDNGCEAFANALVSNISTLAASITASNDATCFGDCDGDATVTESGGTAPFTYLWSEGQTTATATGLCAGFYTVTVEDANTCQVISSVTINEPADFVFSFNVTDVSCFTGNDGLADLVLTGGTSPYTYDWSSGETVSTATNLVAGWYSVTITDDNLCVAIDSVEIIEPAELLLTLSGNDISCFGAGDGDISSVVTGGTLPYSYSWSLGETTGDIIDLAPGNYILTVTDAQLCQTVDNFVISEPADLTSIITATNLTCFNSGNGSINLLVAGGTTPYSYDWNTGETTANIAGLDAGVYDVTITDDNGCQIFDNTAVTEPLELDVVLTVSDASCFSLSDGSVESVVAGGTAPYTYQWNTLETTPDIYGLTIGLYEVTVTDANGCFVMDNAFVDEPSEILISSAVTDATCGSNNGEISTTVSDGVSPYTYNWNNGQTNPTAITLLAGNYNLTVTDDTGCEAYHSTTVNNTGGPSLVIDYETDVTCYGFCDGEAAVIAAMGTPPYTYDWSDGQTNDTVNLCAGTFGVTVTDDNGCIASETAIINEPDTLTGILGFVEPSCFGGGDGVANVVLTGGTTPYFYNWETGGTAATEIGLFADTYSITATDNNGCELIDSVIITEPTDLVVSMLLTDISCFSGCDGSAEAIVSGGSTPYTFVWNNAESTPLITDLCSGTYEVSISDANGCFLVENDILDDPAELMIAGIVTDATCGVTNGEIDVTVSGGSTPYSFIWSEGSTTEDITALAAGTYQVTTTDVFGCELVEIFTLNNIGGPSVSTIGTDASCFTVCDGEATVQAVGGTPPYTYQWSGGETLDTVFDLCAGGYTVTVTDDNNCIGTGTVNIFEPAALGLTELVTDVLCSGGSDGNVEVIVSGGTSPYQFDWAGGETTNQINDIGAGIYDLTVTDANGCIITGSIPVLEPIAISLSLSVNDATCFDDCDGMITAFASGGTAPYTYDWSTGEIMQSISGLCAGMYYVTIFDDNGCMFEDSVAVNEPDEIVVSETITDANCSMANGEISVTTSGGTIPYIYSWSTGGTDVLISGLSAGSYELTVTDISGCESINYYAVNDIGGPTVSINSIEARCFSMCDGEAAVLAAGGTPPYSYEWTSGELTDSIFDLCAGLYSVTVTDDIGCIGSATVGISEPDAIMINGDIVDANCAGDANGSIDVTVLGGTSPYTYDWSNGDNTSLVSDLAAGTYDLTVSDLNGCEEYATFVVSEPMPIQTSIDVTDANCFEECDGFATVFPSGGNAPYFYSWDTGDMTASIVDLCAGSYYVTVYDDNGCFVDDSIEIAEPSEIMVTATVTDASCGTANGEIALSVSGGVAPYSYEWPSGGTADTETALSAGIYEVTITDDNGCMVVEAFTVNNTGAPVITVVATDQTCSYTCDGTIDITAVGGTTPYVYLWSTGDNTANLTDLCEGDYYLTLTDGAGCIASEVVTIQSPLPLSIAMSSTDHVSGPMPNGTASAMVSGGVSPYGYLWDDPSGQTTETAIDLYNGLYEVVVTDANGCIASDTVTVYLFTTIDELITTQEIKIYPIPVVNELNVSISGISSEMKLSIISVQGQIIFTDLISEDSEEIHRTYDLSVYPKGMYFVKIVSDKNTHVQRIITQ